MNEYMYIFFERIRSILRRKKVPQARFRRSTKGRKDGNGGCDESRSLIVPKARNCILTCIHSTYSRTHEDVTRVVRPYTCKICVSHAGCSQQNRKTNSTEFCSSSQANTQDYNPLNVCVCVFFKYQRHDFLARGIARTILILPPLETWKKKKKENNFYSTSSGERYILT